MAISVSAGPAQKRVPGGYTRRAGYKVQAYKSKTLGSYEYIGLFDDEETARAAVAIAAFGVCGHCDRPLDDGDDCGHCGYSGPPDTGDRTVASPWRNDR